MITIDVLIAFSHYNRKQSRNLISTSLNYLITVIRSMNFTWAMSEKIDSGHFKFIGNRIISAKVNLALRRWLLGQINRCQISCSKNLNYLYSYLKTTVGILGRKIFLCGLWKSEIRSFLSIKCSAIGEGGEIKGSPGNKSETLCSSATSPINPLQSPL